MPGEINNDVSVQSEVNDRAVVDLRARGEVGVRILSILHSTKRRTPEQAASRAVLGAVAARTPGSDGEDQLVQSCRCLDGQR